MDSSVIEEIANQLGMAVDQAGVFITEQLPAFAALKVMQASVPLYLWSALLFIAVIVMIVACLSLKKGVNKEVKRFEEDREALEPNERHKVHLVNYNLELTDYTSFYVVVGAFIVTLFLMVILVVVILLCVPKIIGWSNYPEAMLIDMALKAV